MSNFGTLLFACVFVAFLVGFSRRLSSMSPASRTCFIAAVFLFLLGLFSPIHCRRYSVDLPPSDVEKPIR